MLLNCWCCLEYCIITLTDCSDFGFSGKIREFCSWFFFMLLNAFYRHVWLYPLCLWTYRLLASLKKSSSVLQFLFKQRYWLYSILLRRDLGWKFSACRIVFPSLSCNSTIFVYEDLHIQKTDPRLITSHGKCRIVIIVDNSSHKLS